MDSARPDPAAAPAPAPAIQLDMAQAALANIVCALAVQTIEDSRTEVLLGALDELIPACHRNSRMADALLSAAEQIAIAAARRRDGGGGITWAAAILTARAVAFDFLFWRGAAALERHRKDKA